MESELNLCREEVGRLDAIVESKSKVKNYRTHMPSRRPELKTQESEPDLTSELKEFD